MTLATISRLTHKEPLKNRLFNHRLDRRGSSLVELIIVTILFAIFIPAALDIFISGRKITGQSYIQHAAATNLAETADILEFLRNQSIDQLQNGSFYLIRSPGNNSWLIKSDLPNKDTFERYITVSDAERKVSNDNILFPEETANSYTDPSTKQIEISILWAPDYIPLDLISQTFYITDWQNNFTYQ